MGCISYNPSIHNGTVKIKNVPFDVTYNTNRVNNVKKSNKWFNTKGLAFIPVGLFATKLFAQEVNQQRVINIGNRVTWALEDQDLLSKVLEAGEWTGSANVGFIDKLENLLMSKFTKLHLDKFARQVGVFQLGGVIFVTCCAVVVVFMLARSNSDKMKKKKTLEEMNLEIALIEAEKKLAYLKDARTVELEEFELDKNYKLMRLIKDNPDYDKIQAMDLEVKFNELVANINISKIKGKLDNIDNSNILNDIKKDWKRKL